MIRAVVALVALLALQGCGDDWSPPDLDPTLVGEWRQLDAPKTIRFEALSSQPEPVAPTKVKALYVETVQVSETEVQSTWGNWRAWGGELELDLYIVGRFERHAYGVAGWRLVVDGVEFERVRDGSQR